MQSLSLAGTRKFSEIWAYTPLTEAKLRELLRQAYAAGRPSVGAEVWLSVSLTAEQHAAAVALGDGNAAAGIRKALDLAPVGDGRCQTGALNRPPTTSKCP